MATVRKLEIDWKAVGRRVRELRVSQGQLSRNEQGRSEMGAEVLLRLARKSGKTIEWLLINREGQRVTRIAAGDFSPVHSSLEVLKVRQTSQTSYERAHIVTIRHLASWTRAPERT